MPRTLSDAFGCDGRWVVKPPMVPFVVCEDHSATYRTMDRPRLPLRTTRVWVPLPAFVRQSAGVPARIGKVLHAIGDDDVAGAIEDYRTALTPSDGDGGPAWTILRFERVKNIPAVSQPFPVDLTQPIGTLRTRSGPPVILVQLIDDDEVQRMLSERVIDTRISIPRVGVDTRPVCVGTVLGETTIPIVSCGLHTQQSFATQHLQSGHAHGSRKFLAVVR